MCLGCDNHDSGHQNRRGWAYRGLKENPFHYFSSGPLFSLSVSCCTSITFAPATARSTLLKCEVVLATTTSYRCCLDSTVTSTVPLPPHNVPTTVAITSLLSWPSLPLRPTARFANATVWVCCHYTLALCHYCCDCVVVRKFPRCCCYATSKSLPPGRSCPCEL